MHMSLMAGTGGICQHNKLAPDPRFQEPRSIRHDTTAMEFSYRRRAVAVKAKQSIC